MSKNIQLETQNLIIRQWKTSDYLPFSKLNSDEDVMKYFPKLLSREESNKTAKKIKSLIESKGWGVWAVELKKNNLFIGFIGLDEPSLDLPFSPCVEIAWRFDKKYWGKGYATESGNEVLKYAFEILKLDEVVSFTALLNKKSERLMQRLKMINTQQNFEHYALPDGHHLKKHILYKITKEEWLQG